MPRDEPIYRVGDYWLAKRRDGKSPDIWQIARYSEKSRSVIYRSTKCRALDQAKEEIHVHVERERSRKPQTAEAALVVPHLVNYWIEHGADAIKPGVIATSLRAFIGFLMQDEVGDAVTIAELNPEVFQRFRKWRMAPHSFDVPWEGKDYPVDSDGVRGESVQRNLDDVRAALNHAAVNGRIPYAPKVPSVPKRMRSTPRDVRVTIEQLGAMVGFASQANKPVQLGDDPDPNRHFRWWIQLMIATACRPEAALAFDPRVQWAGDLIDLHPPNQPRTKKVNPTVPTIAPLVPILQGWRGENDTKVLSRRTAWRTMRRALELPANVIPKTIRHTILTELRKRSGGLEAQISMLAGHRPADLNATTEVYAKYDPAYLRDISNVLTTIFDDVMRCSEKWTADHLRTKTGNGRVIVVARDVKLG